MAGGTIHEKQVKDESLFLCFENTSKTPYIRRQESKGKDSVQKQKNISKIQTMDPEDSASAFSVGVAGGLELGGTFPDNLALPRPPELELNPENEDEL